VKCSYARRVLFAVATRDCSVPRRIAFAARHRRLVTSALRSKALARDFDNAAWLTLIFRFGPPYKGTRQNRSILNAEADIQLRYFWRETLRSAGCSDDFREPGTSEKTTPKNALPAALSPRYTERPKSLEKSSSSAVGILFLGVFLHQSSQYPMYQQQGRTHCAKL
jgi:hypothetical protein